MSAHLAHAGRLRLAAAAADAHAEILRKDAATARELAEALESATPPDLVSIRQRGSSLFRKPAPLDFALSLVARGP